MTHSVTRAPAAAHEANPPRRRHPAPTAQPLPLPHPQFPTHALPPGDPTASPARSPVAGCRHCATLPFAVAVFGTRDGRSQKAAASGGVRRGWAGGAAEKAGGSRRAGGRVGRKGEGDDNDKKISVILSRGVSREIQEIRFTRRRCSASQKGSNIAASKQRRPEREREAFSLAKGSKAERPKLSRVCRPRGGFGGCGSWGGGRVPGLVGGIAAAVRRM
ncbi:hypothetical protein GUJ93_ZPchr0013g36653 [Zizania palustris]|uniref:Uncharacterized protein n=1 Tax=Zizania palustris TaxID=103762 RepID=A0A8J6BZA8_ZIZPA|nr:hypothetical protein GUJ93_ZPchr0013g36653 [Zizania palustris]